MSAGEQVEHSFLKMFSLSLVPLGGLINGSELVCSEVSVEKKLLESEDV